MASVDYQWYGFPGSTTLMSPNHRSQHSFKCSLWQTPLYVWNRGNMFNSITSIVLCPFYKWEKRNGEEKECRALHPIIERAQIHSLKPPSVFSITPVLLFCTRLLFLHILLENELLCIYLDQNLGWGSLSVSDIKRPFKFNCCLLSIHSCFSLPTDFTCSISSVSFSVSFFIMNLDSRVFCHKADWILYVINYLQLGF